MRPLLTAAGLCALVALAGCGGGAGGGTPKRAVHVSVSAPNDLASVRAATVDVRGTVSPASSAVTVEGRRASVSGGTFTATVALQPGVNVVDVLASDGEDARPALTAVRVRRIITVVIPDVTGLSTDDARTALEGAGFKVDVKRGGGLLDPLLGGSPAVCQSDPAAGAQADAGATVTITVARRC